MRARRSVVVISEVEDEVFFGLFLSRSAAAVGKKERAGAFGILRLSRSEPEAFVAADDLRQQEKFAIYARLVAATNCFLELSREVFKLAQGGLQEEEEKRVRESHARW